MVTDPIDVGDIDILLPEIEPCLEVIAKKHGGYTVEETRRKLKNRVATLHYVGDYGFAICQWSPDVCHVLAAGSLTDRMDCLPRAMDALCEYAASYGCKRISLTSPRKGWSKISSKLGLYIDAVTYARDLS